MKRHITKQTTILQGQQAGKSGASKYGSKGDAQKNKDVEAGLVNGSVGTVVDFGLSATKT